MIDTVCTSESEVSKSLRGIASDHDLVASAHQRSSYMVKVSGKFIRASFRVKLRASTAKGLDRLQHEAALMRHMKGFISDLCKYLKKFNLEVEFKNSSTHGEFRNNWEGRNLPATEAMLSQGESAVWDNLEFMRVVTQMGTPEEMLDTSTPEVWIEFRIIK